MRSRSRVLLAALAGLLGSSLRASGQEFAGTAGLADSLAAVRAAAAAQRAVPQAPETPNVMGGSRFETVQGLSQDPATTAVPETGAYQVRGVDVSHYQGDIDWAAVKRAGVAFAYIKATEGADGTDDQFAKNWKGAAAAGMLKGAYHFYNFCKGGAAQADNFISTVPRGSGDLPVTVDLEKSGACRTLPEKAAFRKQLAVFVEKIRKAYGHKPILYLNAGIYDRYFQGELVDEKLWIADTSHASPVLSDNAPWALWQYGWHGKVDGIPSEVDLDVFNGTPQMLASLSGPSDVLVAALSQ